MEFTATKNCGLFFTSWVCVCASVLMCSEEFNEAST